MAHNVTDRPMDRLLEIMARLRDPDGGCPWDLEQDFASIAPYTIEEAYEVADAIRRGSLTDLRDELGDLLLQVVFHSQMAAEDGHFTFDDVAAGISEKMVRRHPHVFGDAQIASAEAQTRSWEQIKAAERAAKASEGPSSLLDDVPLALPALTRAEKLQKRAARVGFDWTEADQVLAKLDEEMAELKAEVKAGDTEAAAEEMGDLLFVMVNLCRHLKIDPEQALTAANAKFTRRFQFIETSLAAAGGTAEDATLEEMEALWQAAKAREKIGTETR